MYHSRPVFVEKTHTRTMPIRQQPLLAISAELSSPPYAWPGCSYHPSQLTSSRRKSPIHCCAAPRVHSWTRPNYSQNGHYYCVGQVENNIPPPRMSPPHLTIQIRRLFYSITLFYSSKYILLRGVYLAFLWEYIRLKYLFSALASCKAQRAADTPPSSGQIVLSSL